MFKRQAFGVCEERYAAGPMIALLGNVARDVFPGEQPRTGGGPFHAARVLPLLAADVRLYARCAESDRDALLAPILALGGRVDYVPGEMTASFAISEQGGGRRMALLAAGDHWLPADLPALPAEVGWVHVAPLLRSDFPAETLAALGRGRRLSLDGQGLVRSGRRGELALDAAYDPRVLDAVSVLKLSDDEAALLGDPRALPVDEVIVTHGPLGATVYSDGTVAEIPARRVGGHHTGTGDAFAVSYIAARSSGSDPLEAARAAADSVAAMLEEGR